MSYQLDTNGNRTTVTYPQGVQVQQTFDFADRPRSLTLFDGANPPQVLASNAVYEPFGPLASVTLGNGLSEQRSYTSRYFPQTILLPGRLSWSYTTDKLGNPTAISDLLAPTASRSFTYQDSLYFLTGGTGTWGNWSWTYDKIGNRLSETKNGALQNYFYVQQGVPLQNTPKLATRGAITYAYDPIGNLTSANSLQLTWDDAKDLRQLGTQGFNSYDGRGFLTQLSNNGGADVVTATYGSRGQLFHRHDLRGGGAFTSDAWFFDFGGRPLASLEKLVNSGSPQTLLRFYTTDHLNTPILATDATGAVTWTGGFDPFGGDSFSSAQKLRSYHRFPGQWQDNQWYGFSKFADFSYNLHRWYDSATGRYTAPDPLGLDGSPLNLYVYATANPLAFVDPFGLASFKGFPVDKKQQMESAVERAKQILLQGPSCCAGSAGPRLLKLLDQVTFIYDPGLHDSNGPLCGRVKNFFTKTVRIGDVAFDFAQCCLLESTLTHEVNHLRAPSKGSGEDAGRKLEKDCFNCPGVAQ